MLRGSIYDDDMGICACQKTAEGNDGSRINLYEDEKEEKMINVLIY
jgi:hypothetical protein